MQLETLANKFKGKCYWCGHTVRLSKRAKLEKHGAMATRDHKLPVSQGGRNGKNLVLACNRCNSLRGDMRPGVFREFAKNFLPPRRGMSITDRFFIKMRKHIHG